MRNIENRKTPRFDRLLAEGKARLRGNEAIGRAADGMEVVLGNVFYGPRELEAYLAAHPTPDTW